MIIGGIDSVETTKQQTKIIRKEDEPRQHGDSFHQGQSNQECNSGTTRTDNSNEEYTLSKSL